MILIDLPTINFLLTEIKVTLLILANSIILPILFQYLRLRRNRTIHLSLKLIVHDFVILI